MTLRDFERFSVGAATHFGDINAWPEAKCAQLDGSESPPLPSVNGELMFYVSVLTFEHHKKAPTTTEVIGALENYFVAD